MAHSKHRPVHLNLVQIKLPIAGIMSIFHRISGVVLVLATPLLLWLLEYSLSGVDSFQKIVETLHSPLGGGALFILLWALSHHFFAGIRYLLLDVDVGIDKPYYRYSAYLVLIAAPIQALLLTGGLL